MSHMITKQEIIKKGVHMITPEYIAKYYKKELIHLRTSGSTGQYLDIFWDVPGYRRSMFTLCMLRKKYYDVNPDDKMCHFFTPKSYESETILVDNHLGFSKDFIDDGRLDEWYEKIMDFMPSWLVLQPSTAVILCEYIKNKHKIPPKLKYVEFQGEMLDEEIRTMVSDMFGCKTANHYGANEVNTIAYECPYGCMHVLSSNVRVEIADENGALMDDSDDAMLCGMDGMIGDILLTSKNNQAMPFERYRIGDRGRLLHETGCKCGNKNAVIELAGGRANDFVSISASQKSSSFLIVKLMDIVNELTEGAVLQFYVEQHDYKHFLARLYKDEEVSVDAVLAAFHEALSYTSLANVSFRIKFEDGFFATGNDGKYSYFKNFIEQKAEGENMNSESKGRLASSIASSIRMCLAILTGAKEKKQAESGTEHASPYSEKYEQILQLIDDGRLCDAEDLMYEDMPEDDSGYSVMMLKVYSYMNEFDDDFLDAHDFSREEIEVAVNDISGRYIQGLDALSDEC